MSAAHHPRVMHHINTLTSTYYTFSLRNYNKFNISRINFHDEFNFTIQNILPNLEDRYNIITNEVINGELSLRLKL